jgi:hypothetical protein
LPEGAHLESPAAVLSVAGDAALASVAAAVGGPERVGDLVGGPGEGLVDLGAGLPGDRGRRFADSRREGVVDRPRAQTRR